MTRLVLLGGPPGVGKSSVVGVLREMGIACVEADEVSPPGTEISAEIAIQRVIDETESSVNQLAQQGDTILTWVFAKKALYQPFLDHFSGVDVVQIYLVCEAEELQRRLDSRGDRKLVSYALERLEMIRQLTFAKIDTSDMASSDVANAIVSRYLGGNSEC